MPRKDGIDSNSFHDVVMKYKGNVTSPRLRDLVLSVNQTTFQQLKDESIEVLLPSVIKLLNDPSTRDFGLLFLAEGAKKFGNVFIKPSNRTNIQSCITVLDEVLQTRDYDPNIETDLIDLRKFLVSCYQRGSPILV